MADSSGLSDALRNLADSEGSAAAPAPRKEKVASPPPSSEEEDDMLVAEEDEPETTTAMSSAPAVARRRAPAPVATSHTLKEVGACLFTTFSVLMLIVAAWGTLILMGFEIWRSDQPGARTMAQVSQVFYPLALIGLGYSALLFIQISRDKKKEKQAAANRKSRR